MTIKFNKIVAAILSLLFVLTSCADDDSVVSEGEGEGDVAVENAMLFCVEPIATSRLSYSEQEDGGGLSATFEVGETIGLYAFYNNYYYYHNDYSCFAESVIFANHGLVIASDLKSATYEPLMSWTFSTLYGTAPHTLDCVVYYPFREGYNIDYVNMYNDESGAATLEYYYYVAESTESDVDGVETVTPAVVNSDIDFMTAHTRYDEYANDPEAFRVAMLSLGSIPFEFSRQTASLNLNVTKPDDYDDKIVVTGLTVYFDAKTKFSQSVGYSSETSWSELVYDLTATTTCEATLEKTGWDTIWDAILDEGEMTNVSEVDNLLEDSEMLFFPPETEIWKVVFDLTITSVDGDGVEEDGEPTTTTYTWHPHVTAIEANKHYTLNLELDPDRDN